MSVYRVYKGTLGALLCVLLLNSCVLYDALAEDDRVDLKRYPVSTDYGNMTSGEITVFENILAAAEQGVDRVPCSAEVNKYRLLTHLGMYYGSCEGISGLLAWSDTTIFLNPDVFQAFQQNKVIIDARVDEAVATLKEGTDRFKLWQIANYISRRIAYTDGVRQTIDGLNGEGVCTAYAMLFYKMATRLGIRTYSCYGFAGEYHVWNMVQLNGRQYFYDITWYDKDIRDYRYIHSQSAWNREFQINNKWWEG